MRVIVTVKSGCVYSVVSDTDHIKCSVLDLDSCCEDELHDALKDEQEKLNETGYHLF